MVAHDMNICTHFFFPNSVYRVDRSSENDKIPQVKYLPPDDEQNGLYHLLAKYVPDALGSEGSQDLRDRVAGDLAPGSQRYLLDLERHPKTAALLKKETTTGGPIEVAVAALQPKSVLLPWITTNKRKGLADRLSLYDNDGQNVLMNSIRGRWYVRRSGCVNVGEIMTQYKKQQKKEGGEKKVQGEVMAGANSLGNMFTGDDVMDPTSISPSLCVPNWTSNPLWAKPLGAHWRWACQKWTIKVWGVLVFTFHDRR